MKCHFLFVRINGLSYSVVISAYNIRATFIREEPFEKNKITNVLVAATEKKVV